jgi:hypothetical protein
MDDQNLQVSPQAEDRSSEYYEEQGEQKSAFERFAEVFTSPSTAFDGLRNATNRSSIIVWGLVIGVIVNVLTVALWSASPELVRQTRDLQMAPIERAYEEGKFTKKQYEEFSEQIDESFKNPFSVQSLLGVTLGPLLGWAIAAAVVLGIGRGIGSSHEEGISYSTAFSIYVIALMITLVEKVLTSVAMFLTGSVHTSLSAAALLQTDNGILRAALGFISPFTIWWLIVLGTGIAINAHAPRGKAIAFWSAFYVFITLAFAAVAQLFGFMGG